MIVTIRSIINKNIMKSKHLNIIQNRFLSDTWKDKENALENAYFNKEDEKALRKLLKKMKNQTDKNDKTGKVEHEKYDKTGLNKIIHDLNLPKEKVDALLKWKHDQN